MSANDMQCACALADGTGLRHAARTGTPPVRHKSAHGQSDRSRGRTWFGSTTHTLIGRVAASLLLLAGLVTAIPAQAQTTCGTPDLAGRGLVWTGTVTVGTLTLGGQTAGYGFGSSTGGLDDKTFSIDANDYEIDAVVGIAAGANTGDLEFNLKDSDLTSAETAALRLHACDTPYDFSAAHLGPSTPLTPTVGTTPSTGPRKPAGRSI